MHGLAGRTALVIGGTRGIGWSTAQALAADGAVVTVTGRDEKAAVRRAEELAEQTGVKAYGAELDVADFDAVGRLVTQVSRERGGLDILVANAGALEHGVLGMIRAEHVDRMLSVNFSGTLAAVQAAARVMRRRRSGSIVVLSSVVGRHGAVGQTAYAAAKAAVATLARSAARELGGCGIRVNAVAPGVIRTDLVAHLPDSVLQRQVAATPLGRCGTADDVANVIRFLVSDAAAFVTGQVIGVDGGLVP